MGLGTGTTVIGSTNTTRTKIFGTLETSAYTVATLPAGTVGKHAYVTDGAAALAWGATVTGGGTAQYLVWHNGTAWTVVGK